MLLVVVGVRLPVSVFESRVLCFNWKEIVPVVPQIAGFDFSFLQVCVCDVAAVQRLLSVTECCKGLQCCSVLHCVAVCFSEW